MSPDTIDALRALRFAEAHFGRKVVRTVVLSLRDGCYLVLSIDADGVARQNGLPGDDRQTRERLEQLVSAVTAAKATTA
jgi:hypothetical protein